MNKRPCRTQLVTTDKGQELKLPIIDLAKGKKFTHQTESLRNTLLEKLFKPEELQKLTIVKTDPNQSTEDNIKDLKILQSQGFEDKVSRQAVFSSGSNIFYADKELASKISQFFKTEPDTACRYGSLLTSNCMEGVKVLDNSEKPWRVKIVDSDSKDAKTQAEAQQYQTGDCHGKISPRLAKTLGTSANRPFQFRLAWMKDWSAQNCQSPHTDFIAKGTFLPDKSQTTDKGYDLILDRSSIKGINKTKLDELVPCGDYTLPKAVIGNRSNAKVQQYENSWQFLQWFNEDAIKKDIVAPTKTAAEKLASVQGDRLKLRDYIINQHDRRQNLISTNNSEQISTNPDNENPEQEQNESRLISLLRNDKHGQLLDFPKIASFMQDQVARKWKDLAIKGAIDHGSALAQPCNDLKEGTIVAPHLKDGIEVIVTRYPIVSKDNIRRYTVDNSQKPELTKYKGCAFIRPDEAMKHHQCDFDGDQLVITPASRMPEIAKEIRRTDEENEFEPVEKRPKVSYLKKYNKLYEIAVAAKENQIGRVATQIGRVQTSIPSEGEPTNLFKTKQRKLLGKLFDALQIEVDSPKSATRMRDYHPNLHKVVKKWKETHPSHLFDFKNDDRLYKSIPLPAEDKNPINVIAREAVNPIWQQCKVQSRQRHEFRYLMPSQEELGMSNKEWEHYIDWAKQTKQDFIKGVGDIKSQGLDETTVKEGFNQLYDNLRTEVSASFANTNERQKAASALWHTETTRDNQYEVQKACKKLSRKLKPEFELVQDYALSGSAFSKDCYVLSVPFEKYARDDNGKVIGTDYAEQWKKTLDDKGIKYQAIAREDLPMVDFALIDPPTKIVEALENKFGNNINDPEEIDLTYTDRRGKTHQIRIIPPNEYEVWLEPNEDIKPKSSLVINLFTEEICDRLQKTDYLSKMEVIGLKYNEHANTDFNCLSGKLLKFEVDTLSNPSNNSTGSPIVKLEGKTLGMFSQNSPKVAPGLKFEGTISAGKSQSSLNIEIDPQSIERIEEPMNQEQATDVQESQPSLTDSLNNYQPALQPKKRKQSLRELAEQIKGRKAIVATVNDNNQTDDSQKSLHHDEASVTLLKAIADHYQSTGQKTMKIGTWKGLIGTGESCLVKDEHNQMIFNANLKSEKILQPLSPDRQNYFNQMARQQHQNLESQQL